MRQHVVYDVGGGPHCYGDGQPWPCRVARLRRLRRKIVALFLGVAGIFGLQAMVAVPTWAACPVDTSTTEANHDIPGTIDGNIAMRTDYYDCGTYVIVSSRKWDAFSGKEPRGYYDANIAYYSGGTWRYMRTGQSFGENTWINMVDFSCYKPCTMVHVRGSMTDLAAWPDGTVDAATDALT